VFVGVLSATTVAEAQVLTFDEMAPDPQRNPILGSVMCSASTGFRFQSDHFHVIGQDYPAPFAWDGSTFLGYESGRGFPIVLEREGTGTFSLFSLDAGEFYGAHDPEHPDAEWITLTGYQAGGGIVTHSFFLDGIRDGSGGLPDFEHFVLPPTFVNLRSVVFNGWLQGNIPGGLAFDNLEYQLDDADTIPPCTWVALPPEVPVVTLLSPASGIVSGNIQIEATATDNQSVANVVFKINGLEIAAPDLTAPYTLEFDTTSLPDGEYTLSAEARDNLDNLGSASILITIQNEVIVSDGPHYVSFDGVDDAVVVADAPALSFGTGATDTPLTVELWLRPDTIAGRHQLVGKAGEYRVALIYGGLMVSLYDASAAAQAIVVSNVDLSPLVGAWHHLAVTYDGRGGATAAAGITVYLDGQPLPLLRETSAGYVAMENLPAPIEIAHDSAALTQYAGALDELRLWNVLRSQNDVQSAMGSELTGVEPGLVGYWRFNEGAGLSVADDSPGTSTAALIHETAWVADGPLAPDTTPPVINNITVSNITASSALISFTTDEASTGWVTFGAGTTCPCSDVFSGGAGTAHSIVLTGLAPETSYQFNAKASDGSGNLQVALPLSFETIAPQSDLDAPVVALTSPAAGAVNGSVTIAATAADNVGVVSVTFLLDGVALGPAITTAPYSLSWDASTAADGPHTLTAEARDADQNVGTAAILIGVENAGASPGPHVVDFDGVDDAVVVADAPALSFGTGAADTPLTVELWVQPDAIQGRHHLVGKAGEYRVALTYGGLIVDLYDASAAAQATVVSNVDLSPLVGAWHHLAVTYHGRGGATAAAGITVYLDGQPIPLLRETSAGYVAMENGAAPVEIGYDSARGNLYGGGLDELRPWNALRSQPDLQAAMSSELTGDEPGLVGYWRFNEGTGLSSTDASPGTATAVLLNGALWVAGGPLAPNIP